MTIQETINQGLQRHQAGKLSQAETLYRQVLTKQPNHPDALNLLGVLVSQLGRHEEGLRLIGAAIALVPTGPYYLNQGTVLEKLGRADEAIGAYRQALVLRADYPQALSNLGNALRAKGEIEESITVCRKAISVRPGFAEAHVNLGKAMEAKGDLDAAITAYQQALALQPDMAEANYYLGTALSRQGRLDEGVAVLRQAVALQPNWAQAFNNLGTALVEQSLFDQAELVLRRATALTPDDATIHNNLGNALRGLDRHEEAIAAIGQAMKLRPDYPDAQNSLGTTYHEMGDIERAAESYRKAVEMNPDYALAHWNLGMMLLAQGQFADGWQEYEWRWKCPQYATRRAYSKAPNWDGSELKGQRILLQSDQGLGDAIQSIRYLPQVADRGGKIILACPVALHRLFAGIGPIERIVSSDEPPPWHDVRCALMSLPSVLGSTVATIPYLSADPALKQQWRSRMPGDRHKIGLVWAGRPEHQNDRNRSLPLAKLVPLAQIPDAWFCSLQLGPAAAQVRAWPTELTDWTEELKDLADTAALIENLDLIVTVDTAVAHLAGALAKPVLLLLPFVADWRWRLRRSDATWYPTMRLYRQPVIGDWETPVGKMAEELKTHWLSVVGSLQ